MEDIKLDKLGGSESLGTIGKDELNVIKNMYKLVDPFRKLFPNREEYTWSSNTVACRLDRFYISSHLLNYTLNVEHVDSLKSDHNFVSMYLGNLFNVPKKGPGYWHCNVKDLEDKLLCEEMEVLWGILNQAEIKDVGWWENCKIEVKKLIIKHSTRIKRERDFKLKELKSLLRFLNNSQDPRNA